MNTLEWIVNTLHICFLAFDTSCKFYICVLDQKDSILKIKDGALELCIQMPRILFHLGQLCEFSTLAWDTADYSSSHTEQIPPEVWRRERDSYRGLGTSYSCLLSRQLFWWHACLSCEVWHVCWRTKPENVQKQWLDTKDIADHDMERLRQSDSQADIHL